MKNYVVFIFSCVLLYIVLQILSGWVLTAFYTPDLSLTTNSVSKEVEFGQTSIIPLLATLSIASLAYFLSRKLFNTK